ncbi:MAG TPA: tetratricopeptide repeat protein [Alphaproteobacteria bacterium]|nr:tetratricopeptide repeat protein [Alphaproteobacteria bacterium]
MTAANPIPSVVTALKHHQEGRSAEAEAAYRAVLAHDPYEPMAPALLGTLLLRDGRASEALPFLKRAVEIRPDDPETHLAYANALLSAEKPADAVAHYRLLLERWPQKAAAWSNLAEALRSQGDHETALAAAERALQLLPALANAHLARGNALLGLGQAADAEDSYRAALVADPTLAAAHASLGAALIAMGRFAEAAAAADRALEAQPKLAEARFVLGSALRAQGDRDGAIAAFETTVRIDPRHERGWLNLGNALMDADRFEEADTAYHVAIALKANFAEAHSSLGCLLSRQGRVEEALVEFDCAIAIRPDYAEAHWNQGFALLLAGDFARGWEKYEWRKRHDRFAKTFPELEGPAWEGEEIAGKRILVYAEQGLGDSLQFVRYAALLAQRGAAVILACDPLLIPLLQSARGVAAAVPKSRHLPPYDLWVDQMSLPRIFGTEAKNIPTPSAYLAADPARIAAWKAILPAGRKIGVVWAGNPGHSNDARRSMPIEMLRPLLSLPQTSLISLQVGAAARDARKLGPDVIDFSSKLVDFAETAALVANLDLVVTVDTAVAHLSGALGTPTRLLVPHAPDWRWMLAREDTPWYESMRLLRQPTPGDWESPVARLMAELTVAV